MMGILAVAGTVGFGTYALFSASTSNLNNTFTAGTLAIDSKRSDIPFEGPMFYTTNTSPLGGLPTGVWAPGDKNTRGLFLTNNGSLSAKLSTLTAVTADSDGTAVKSGQSYTDDMLFAQQAHVLIWNVEKYDPSKDIGLPWSRNMSATDIDDAMTWINEGYKYVVLLMPGLDLKTQAGIAQAMDTVNNYLLQNVNNLTATDKDGKKINNGTLKVVQLQYKALSDLVGHSNDVSDRNITIKPDEAALLAFTVNMDLKTPTGIEPNSMQGKSVYFNFGTDWTQK